jgi:hypothetical protein
MTSERDATRIVRTWLESGSTTIPDRVVDAVLAELPSRPQRRPRWSPRRTQPMKFALPIAVGAAAVALVAVVLGSQFLPDDSNVGVPTSSPSTSPPPTPSTVGGQFVFGDNWPVDIDATSDGTSLSGSVVGTYDGKEFTIELQCLRRYDAQTWMLAGVATESADSQQPDGSWAVVIIRDGSPQQAGVQTKPHGLAEDCEDFVRNIPDSAVEGFEMIGPMDDGSITLPVAPAPSASPAT